MKPDEKTPEQTFKVLLLADYWPTPAEVAANPEIEGGYIAPAPNADASGVEIVIEPRFKAGTEVELTLNSAFKLVEEGKAKRVDWNA